MDMDIRASLRPRAEIAEVWCDRCQRRHHGVSQEDYDTIVRDGGKALAAAIDEAVGKDVYSHITDDDQVSR